MSGACGACRFQDTPYLGATCGPAFAIFMGILETFLKNECDIADPCNRLGRDGRMFASNSEFDFIVAGAGVAGPVVAGRLSENPAWKVLLIEAGPEEPTATQIPGFAMNARYTIMDWNYTTVTQKDACLNTGGFCEWPRGKMVSGTGSMHGMMYTRGHASIYDDWAKMGNKGWAFKDVLPYFKMSENNKNPEVIEKEYHGFKGPLTVQRYPYQPPLAKDLVKAFQEMGYRRGDLCGRNQTGADIAQMMVDKGLRASTPRIYLRPYSGRKNLQVAINSHVTKILIDPKNNCAYGVQILTRDGQVKNILAKKEVIVSGGAVGSPHMLLLSGIGPKKDLNKVGIPVIKDLPVGRNLMNHVSTGISFYINDTFYETLNLQVFNEFIQTRTGPLSSTGITQTTAFIKSKYVTNDVPDLQVFFDGYTANCSRTGLPKECTDGDIYRCGRRRIDVRPTVVLPRSVGYLKLKSANPLEHPLIDPQYFSNKRDLEVLVDGLKIMTRFALTNTMKRWGMELVRTPVKGCEDYHFGSDKYWACHIRRDTGPENHQGGTCRMGPAGDPKAVVDPQFRVHGVNYLRVVDASVFPYVPNGNPISAIVMMSERCAIMIKDFWQNE
ncbi:glucose dehydrogenase [FAD, quinone]-like [Anabrus simplex]|uniref:glucose dehydrogenase [FAD, quinone]-like n=1 Tax=Anabrus simplex TaxID=316456 RepID=UPI0035A31CDD